MHPQTPRRTSPTKGFTLPGLTYTQPILPLNDTSPISSRSFRSSARRISYGIKNRLGRFALPLSIGGIITVLLIFMTWSRGHGFQHASHRVKLYTREQIEQTVFNNGAAFQTGKTSSASGEEEFLAEDDVFIMSYKEPVPPTEAEIEAEEEFEAHRQNVIDRNAIHSVKALLWFLAQGNIIPNSFEMPSKARMATMGGKGMERLLEDADGHERKKGSGRGRKGKQQAVVNEDIAFPEGWLDLADQELRLVVFSKSYCPFSKRAKAILQKYRLNPSPYIIELDKRSDMGHIQNLLMQLTGRRTVPNIMLNFKSLGGADELTLLDAEGGLQKLFDDNGVGRPRRNAYKAVPNKAAPQPVPKAVKEPAPPPRNAAQPGRVVDHVIAQPAGKVEKLLEEDRPVARGQSVPKAKNQRAPIDLQDAVRLAHRVADRIEGLGEFEDDYFPPQALLDSPRSNGRDHSTPENLVRPQRQGNAAGPGKPGSGDTPQHVDSLQNVPDFKDRSEIGGRQAIGKHAQRQKVNVENGNGRQRKQVAKHPVAQQPVRDLNSPLDLAQQRSPNNPANTKPRRPVMEEDEVVVRQPKQRAKNMDAKVQDSRIRDRGPTEITDEESLPVDPRRRQRSKAVTGRQDVSALDSSNGLELAIQEDNEVPETAARMRDVSDLANTEVDLHAPAAKHGKIIHAPHPEDRPGARRVELENGVTVQKSPLIPADKLVSAPIGEVEPEDEDEPATDEDAIHDDEENVDALDDFDPQESLEESTIDRYVDLELSALIDPKDLVNDQFDDRDNWAYSSTSSTLGLDSWKSTYDDDESQFRQAPDPRQLEDDGVAALSAAASNLRRRPNGKLLRDVVEIGTEEQA